MMPFLLESQSDFSFSRHGTHSTHTNAHKTRFTSSAPSSLLLVNVNIAASCAGLEDGKRSEDTMKCLVRPCEDMTQRVRQAWRGLFKMGK